MPNQEAVAIDEAGETPIVILKEESSAEVTLKDVPAEYIRLRAEIGDLSKIERDAQVGISERYRSIDRLMDLIPDGSTVTVTGNMELYKKGNHGGPTGKVTLFRGTRVITKDFPCAMVLDDTFGSNTFVILEKGKYNYTVESVFPPEEQEKSND